MSGDSTYEELFGRFDPSPARRPTLLVGLDGDVTAEDAHRVKADLQERLPHVEVVLISRCTSMTLIPGDGPS